MEDRYQGKWDAYMANYFCNLMQDVLLDPTHGSFTKVASSELNGKECRYNKPVLLI